MSEPENPKLRSLLALYAVLQIPLMVLNACGAVIAGTWLCFLGEWGVVLLGLVCFVGATFLMPFVLLPASLFGLALVARSGEMPDGRLVPIVMVALSQIYITAVITAWGSLVLYVCARMATPGSLFPVLLLGYEVATGPWATLAAKDHQTDSRSNSGFPVLFLSVGYVVAMVFIWLDGAIIQTGFIVLAAAMALSWIVQVVIFAIEFSADRRALGLE
jgi:hypothetical protein